LLQHSKFALAITHRTNLWALFTVGLGLLFVLFTALLFTTFAGHVHGIIVRQIYK